MAKLQQAVFSYELPAADQATPEWVHLLPAGTFSGRDGRGPYKLENPDDVIARSMADGPVPLDYAHALVGQIGSPAPAAGWIEEMQMRSDGIWGRVSWTPKGRQALADREYRALSPVFVHDKSGTVHQIANAGLVNNPNLYLQAVASRQDGRDDGGADMAELKDLAAQLGLPETATVEQISAKIAEQKAAHQAELKAIAEATGHKGEVSANAIAAHARTLAIGATDPDPAKFVPMSVHNQTVADLSSANQRLAALEQRNAETDAETAVNSAIREGKVIPAQKDWALSYARKDLAGFKAWSDAAPVVLKPGTADAHADSAALAADRPLDETDLAVCRAMGLDPEKFKAARKEGA